MSADDVHQDLTDTIVLIHGLWLTALSWEHWIGRVADYALRWAMENALTQT